MQNGQKLISSCQKASVWLVAMMLALPSNAAFAGDNSFWGTTVGAALGGLAGSQIGRGAGRLAATGAGVFLGGALGNSIGTSMDRANSAYYAAPTYSYSYPPYATTYYEPTYVAPPAPIDPPQRRVIYVQPQEVVEYREATPTYVQGGYVGGEDTPSGYCREYTQRIRVNGRMQESYGTACLQPDGSWQIVH